MSGLGNVGRPPKAYTDEDAVAWRRQYDEDDTLYVSELAERHHVDHEVMRRALLFAGGALRHSGVTMANRRRKHATGE